MSIESKRETEWENFVINFIFANYDFEYFSPKRYRFLSDANVYVNYIKFPINENGRLVNDIKLNNIIDVIWNDESLKNKIFGSWCKVRPQVYKDSNKDFYIIWNVISEEDYEYLEEDEILERGNVITTNKFNKGDPQFILPSGKIISVSENLTDEKFILHTAFVNKFVKEILTNIFPNAQVDITWSNEIILEKLTDRLGWIRTNTGTKGVDERFYCVFPDFYDYTPTKEQYDVFKEFIHLGQELKRSKLLVYCGNNSETFKNKK